MGQNNKIGTQVGPSAAPAVPTGGVYQPPPPGTLGALSNRLKQPPPALPEGIDPTTLLLLARQFPQLFGRTPSVESFDMSNASVQDPLVQTMMHRIK